MPFAQIYLLEGRIIRQGNENESIEVFRYVTENTFDAYMWQTIESKQKFISQIMTSKSPVRSCEDIDETALSYAEVKAPISGLVSAKRIEVGDMAAPGAPLFTIDDVSRVKVLAELAEADLAGVVPGAPARARIDALGREFAATVDRVAPAGDPRSRTFEVQIVVDNKDGALRPGMYARALFPKAPRKALFVPKSALTTRGELVGLYALDDEGAARLRWIRVGREDGDKVEVLSGLAAGERYVAAPPAELVDGAPVAAR